MTMFEVSPRDTKKARVWLFAETIEKVYEMIDYEATVEEVKK